MFDKNAKLDALFENTEDLGYDVRMYYKEPEESRCVRIATNDLFGNLTLVVIAFNVLWLAIDADLNTGSSLADAPPLFVTMELLFAVFFTFEIGVRLGSFKKKTDARKDGWTVFDSLIVALMLFELILVPLMAGGGVDLGSLSVLKIFRIARVFRMARIVRSVPELVILIKGMAAASRAVSMVGVLLLLMVYVFALVFRMIMGPDPSQTEASSRQLAYSGVSGAGRIWQSAFRRGLASKSSSSAGGEFVEFPFNFNSVPEAMTTLLLAGALIEGIDAVILLTAGVCEDCEGVIKPLNIVMTMVFCFFVVLANLTLLNMLIGVLCEVINGVGAYEKDKSTVEFAKSKLLLSYSQADLNEDNRLQFEEFRLLMTVEEVRKVLEGLDIDPYVIDDMTTLIFHEDSKYVRKNAGALDFPHFLQMMLEFRSSQMARVTDLVEIRRAMGEENDAIRKRIDALKQGLAELLRIVDLLLELEDT
jgi:hypothetical protein